MNSVQAGIPHAGNGYRNTYGIQTTNRATHFGDYPYLFEQNDEYSPHGLKQTYSKSSNAISRVSCGHLALNPTTQERSLWQPASDLPDETNGFWGLETYQAIGVHYVLIEMTEDNNDIHRPYEGVTVTIEGKKRHFKSTLTIDYSTEPDTSETSQEEPTEEAHFTTHTFSYEDSFGAAGAGRDDIIVEGYAPMSVSYAEEKDSFLASKRTITREFESYPAFYPDPNTGQMVEYTRWRTKLYTDVQESWSLDYNGSSWQYEGHSTPVSIAPSNFRESMT